MKKQQFNIQHFLIAPLCIAALSILAFYLGDTAKDQFDYLRPVATTEWWRMVTAHVFHTNDVHLTLNLSALVLLSFIHKQFYRTSSISILFIVSAFFVSIGIFIFTPEMERYVGLSGVLHGFFVWGALKDISVGEKTGYLLLGGVILKLIYEQLAGPNQELMNLIEANVAIDAHVYGAVAGLFYFVITWLLSLFKYRD